MNNLSKILRGLFYICVIGFIGIAMISFSMDDKRYQGLSESDQMLYRFLNRQGKILGTKYHMRQCATGLGGMDKLWMMALSFERYGEPLTENEARKLIINCIDDFLAAVNNDEQIKPLLQDYPFTAKNLEMEIFNYDKDRILHRFPYIGIVMDSTGEIGFLTKEKSAQYGYYTEKYETYDEAVAILKSESSE